MSDPFRGKNVIDLGDFKADKANKIASPVDMSVPWEVVDLGEVDDKNIGPPWNGKLLCIVDAAEEPLAMVGGDGFKQRATADAMAAIPEFIACAMALMELARVHRDCVICAALPDSRIPCPTALALKALQRAKLAPG